MTPLYRLCSLFQGNRLFIAFLLLTAQASAKTMQDTAALVTLKLANTPIEDVFLRIESQTGFAFMYSTQVLNKSEKVSVNFQREALSAVLQELLGKRNLRWVFRDKGIVVLKGGKPIVQTDGTRSADSIPGIDIKGTVVDKGGNPIPGATIALKGKSRGQSTDGAGRFAFSNMPANGIIVVTSIGFEGKQVSINGQKDFFILLDTLVRDIQGVEVVSTGYQIIPKERATGSFVQVSNKTYNEQVGTNVLTRLPAIASGVNVTPGRLTANQYAMTIRGVSTIGGPQKPLIIVDNFPYEGDINNLNPNDVENITILRDAAAASIWGTRAGNGVIVITTKKGGFNSRMKLELTANLTISEEPDLNYFKSISSGDYIDAERFLFDRGYYNASLENNPLLYQTSVVDMLEKIRKGQISASEGNAKIDGLRNRDVRDQYKKYMYEPGVNQQYAVSARGGGNTYAWLFSAGYDRNKSELQAHFERYTFRIENVYKPLKNLELSLGVTYAGTKNITGAIGYRELPTARQPPYELFRDEAGGSVPLTVLRASFLDTIGRGKLLDWNYYPAEDYKHSRTRQDLQSIVGRLGVTYSLNRWISAGVNYQIEKQNVGLSTLFDSKSFYARDLINRFTSINYANNSIVRAVPNGGIKDVTDAALMSQNLRGQVNVKYQQGKSDIAGIVGGEIRDILNNTRSDRYFGYDPDLLTVGLVDPLKSFPLVDERLGTTTIPANNSISKIQNRYVSLFSNFSYTYDNKYTASASFRRDASNLFGVNSNDKWNPFWSAGGAWNIAEENFFNIGLLPDLKLRATYGFSGNVSPNASSLTTIQYFSPSPYTNTPRATPRNYRNQDLRWEKVSMFNVGLDFGLKGRKVTGSIEYYRKIADDLYGAGAYDRTLGLGVSTIQKNNGKMSGRGVDLILNTFNVDRKVQWSTTFLLSYYQDKVEDFYFPAGLAGDYVTGLAAAKGYTRYPVFSYKFAGLDPATGNPVGWLNGKRSMNYNALTYDSARVSDLNYHGTATPRFFGSLGNTVSYRNITFIVRITYQLGHYFIRNSINYASLFSQGAGHSDFSKRWQKAGDEVYTSVPSMPYPLNESREFFYSFSEPLVSKADHVRLQYLSLGYDLLKSTWRKLPVSRLNVALMGNNLGIIWRANKYKLDPLYVDNQLPPSPNYVLSLRGYF